MPNSSNDHPSKSTALKACPFCGGEGVQDTMEVAGDTDTTQRFIRCLGCAAEGPWSNTEAGATRMWNSRSIHQRLQERP